MKKVSNKICFGALTIFVLGDFAVKSENSLPTRKKKKNYCNKRVYNYFRKIKPLELVL